MKCDKVSFLISAGLDKALSRLEAAELQAHLETCAACQTDQRQMLASWALLETLKPIEPSPDFRARFWERVRWEELEAKNWWDVFVPKRFVPVAAGFMVIWTLGMAGGVFLFDSFSRPAELSPSERGMTIFTAPLPPNSIEQIYLRPHLSREDL